MGRHVNLSGLAGLVLGVWLCLVMALALTSCGSTLGLTVRCTGHCHVIPADLHARHAPGYQGPPHAHH